MLRDPSIEKNCVSRALGNDGLSKL